MLWDACSIQGQVWAAVKRFGCAQCVTETEEQVGWEGLWDTRQVSPGRAVGRLPGGRQHGNRETLSVLQGQKFKGHRGCGSINLAKVAASHVGL